MEDLGVLLRNRSPRAHMGSSPPRSGKARARRAGCRAMGVQDGTRGHTH